MNHDRSIRLAGILLSALWAGLTASPTDAPPRTEARGRLAESISLTAHRILHGGMPAYDEAFVLADVIPGSGRRFSNFSGDVSGRYVEALSALPPPGGNGPRLQALVDSVLALQGPDGRFGRRDLAFTPEETGNEHMALLWGNGRLLVGLLAHHRATGDPRALAAAKRLAGFILTAAEAAKHPAVRRRAEGQAAFGYICFTQTVEGLVELARVTGEKRLLAAAREFYGLLPPRGIQHSHGYLTTLRGGLALYETVRDPALLASVRARLDSLVSSTDYWIDGGVAEYFGWGDPANLAALAPAQNASGADPRNEGCGLADFIRLSLGLYRNTGETEYLDLAERCVENAFDHNRFDTGDYGHRVWFRHGFKHTPSVGRAWWCCTLHGYRAAPDILDAAVTRAGGAIRVNLFEDVDWSASGISLSVRRSNRGLSVEWRSGFSGSLGVRVPAWAPSFRAVKNGKAVPADTADGFLRVQGGFESGDRVEVEFENAVRLVGRDGREIPAEEWTRSRTPVEAALFVGPWLMAADESLDPAFFGEPWEGNVIRLPERLTLPESGPPHIAVDYEHGGFPGLWRTVLRPLGEKPSDERATRGVWLRFTGADMSAP